MSSQIILVICSLEWNISEQTIFLPLINCCWNFSYVLLVKTTFEIEKNQSPVCTWDEQLQVCRSNSQSERPVVSKGPLERTGKFSALLFTQPSLHTTAPADLIPPSAYKPFVYKKEQHVWRTKCCRCRYLASILQGLSRA